MSKGLALPCHSTFEGASDLVNYYRWLTVFCTGRSATVTDVLASKAARHRPSRRHVTRYTTTIEGRRRPRPIGYRRRI